MSYNLQQWTIRYCSFMPFLTVVQSVKKNPWDTIKEAGVACHYRIQFSILSRNLIMPRKSEEKNVGISLKTNTNFLTGILYLSYSFKEHQRQSSLWQERREMAQHMIDQSPDRHFFLLLHIHYRANLADWNDMVSTKFKYRNLCTFLLYKFLPFYPHKKNFPFVGRY